MFTNIQIFTGIQVYSVLSQVVHSRICLWPSRCSHLDPLLIRAYIYKYTHITSQKLLYMKPCNADSQMFVPLRVLTCHSKNLVSKKKLTDKTPGSKCGGLVGFSVWIQNILEKQVLSVCRYIYIYTGLYSIQYTSNDNTMRFGCVWRWEFDIAELLATFMWSKRLDEACDEERTRKDIGGFSCSI